MRRFVTVIAVEPEISLDLDPEEHDRETRRSGDVVSAVAAEYGAAQPEPFLLLFTQEDHVERGTSAAHAIREALNVRVGIATGEAMVRDGSVGGPVAARARRNAQEDGAAYAPADIIERRVDGPFVGRQRELAQLRKAQAAVILGPPGIGKSRLARELTRGQPVAFGRCFSYGAMSLAPLHEIATALGEPDALAELWAAEVPSAFRRLCERSPQPLLVVFDDVHWADRLVVETIEHLVEHGDGSVRVLCLAREELLEEQPAFLSSVERLTLTPLAPEDAQLLAEQLADVDAAVLERALAAAEGNPLFLEQVLAHATEVGGPLPATLQSLLAARLDRLTPSERVVVERAAVIGREFDTSRVGQLVDVHSARRPLEGLVQRGLLESVASTTPFEERFRFRHVLIQEATYAATPKEERSRLHERLADLLTEGGESDELIGFHLEQAVQLRENRDRHARQLAQDAGTHLGNAGMVRWKLGYVTHGATLLTRASQLLGNDERRRELLCELGIALNRAGETAKAEAALDEAVQGAVNVGDRRIELRGKIELAALRMLGDSGGNTSKLVGLLDEARPVFKSLGDERSLGRAWMLSGWIQGGLYCRYEEWEHCATHALRHYRAAGFPSSTCIGHIAAAVYFGPKPVTTAIERCESLLGTEVDDRPGEAGVRIYLGGLEGMRGNFDQATEHVAAARTIYEDLGHSAPLLLTCAPVEAQVMRWRGDLDGAVAILVGCCLALEERANWFSFSSHAATLADLLLTLGRDEEALTWLNAAQLHARPEDLDSRIPIGSVHARLMARAGEHASAESAVDESLGLAEQTDALNLRAQVLFAAAEVFAAAHRDEEATAALARARALYAEKENAAAAALLSAAATAS